MGHLWETYKKRISSGEDTSRVLNELGVERYCCRAILLGHADMLPQVAKFKKS